MSFVGTRPEAVKYVEKYKPEYFATLLLPAGITSEASIRYKNEAQLNGKMNIYILSIICFVVSIILSYVVSKLLFKWKFTRILIGEKV